ncbi:MAG: S8/S53 family peptidase [Chitinophagaceae bacterium]
MNRKSVDAFQKQLNNAGGKTFIVLQFNQLPGRLERSTLEKAGIRLLSYIPEYAYVAEITQELSTDMLEKNGVIALISIDSSLKLGPTVLETIRRNPERKVVLEFFETLSTHEIRQLLSVNDRIISDELLDTYHQLTVQLTPERVIALSHSPFVEYISLAAETFTPLNNESRTLARTNVLQSSLPGAYNLSGAGVTIGIYELLTPPFLHADFASRLISTPVSVSDNSHSTHVTGIAAGSGLINPFNTGHAPGANLIIDNPVVTGLAGLNHHRYEGMVLTNNSYGTGSVCSPETNTNTSRLVDKQSIDYPSLLHVFATGNSGTSQCSRYPLGFNTVHTDMNSSKSTLSVGNIQKNGILTPSSSKGPEGGGRLKPEIVAVGTNVLSTIPGNTYGLSSGTSMAAPAVTGGLALLYQRYKQIHNGINPSGALMKAILCNTANDLGNQGPDFSYGFGAMNLLRAVKVLDQQQYLFDSVQAGAEKTHQLNIPEGKSQLKLMLYWPDPPPTALSGRALVNDLDLELISANGSVTLPLVLDTTAANVALPALPGKDHLNNVEQIIINNPPAGNYTVHVSGNGITQNGIQSYYLTYDLVPDNAQLTFPYGGEAFNPRSKLLVQWDAWGNNAGGFSLSYSCDGGMSWSTINASIPQEVRQFEWSLPDTVSGQTMLRLTRHSDNTFHQSQAFTILGTPAPVLSSSQCPGSIKIEWPAIKGADSYNILLAIKGEMQKIATIINTFYTIHGLSADSLAYVSVQSTVGTATGPRSVAIGRQPNSGNCEDISYHHDLAVHSIISPISGRNNTSTALQATHLIKVRVENRAYSPATGYLMQYRVNNGPFVSETIDHTILPGDSYDHLFTTPCDLSAPGSYKIEVIVSNPGDTYQGNDTLITFIKNINNPVIDLVNPLVEDFQSSPESAYQQPVIGLEGLDHFDYYPGSPFNSIHIQEGTFIDSTSRTLQLSRSQRYTTEDSRLIGTYNLSGFDIHTRNVSLDFIYYRSELTTTKDSLWVRGNDQAVWLPAISLSQPGTFADNVYYIKGLDLGEVLKKGGQDFSSSFQLLWNKKPSSVFYNIDNITFYNSSYDAALISIDTPLSQNIGILNQVAPQISVHNYAPVALRNIVVSYQLDSGPVVSEIIDQIDPFTTYQYKFSKPVAEISVGQHTFRSWVTLDGDTHPENNELVINLFSAPYIQQFPYLEDFENGDGGFYTEGRKSSLAHGTIGFGKIQGAASGTKAWKTNLNGNYNADEYGILYSPVFDLSGLNNPYLSFSLSVNTDYCFNSSYCDGLTISRSINGGNWIVLTSPARMYKYSAAQNTPGRFRWQVSSIGLPPNAANIRFRFIFRSDEFNNYEGVGIDDFHIYDSTHAIYEGPGTPNLQPMAPTADGWFNYLNGQQLVASIKPGSPTRPIVKTLRGEAPGNFHGQYYLNRSFIIQSDARDSFMVRLFLPDAAVDSLLLATSCNTCTKPYDAYRLGISVYQTNSLQELNGTPADNLTGKWRFIPRHQVKMVPFLKGYYLEFKTIGNAEYWFNHGGLDSNSYLPLPILHLNATAFNTQSRLSWSVPNEINIDRYEIEVARSYSQMLKGSFEKTGEVKSRGRSSVEQWYNYEEQITLADTFYYRIKVVDVEGYYSYSEPVILVRANDFQWRIAPNPTTGVFMLTYLLPQGETAQARVMNVTGQLIGKFELRGTGTIQKTNINLTNLNLSTGLYFIRITSNTAKVVLKLVKY